MKVITEAALRAMEKHGLPNPLRVGKTVRLTPAAADYMRARGISCSREEAETVAEWGAGCLRIPVGVSNRHVHLSERHVEQLFGPGYQLTPLKELSQPGQFAAKEQVTLMGPKGWIQQVRILGPARGNSQVEISRTDGFQLGIHPPLRLSGSIDQTPGIALIGPAGTIVLEQGVIVAQNHVHMSPDDALRFGVSEGDRLMLQTNSPRKVLFMDVVVRINERYRLDFHVDTDEGNGALLQTGDYVTVVGKNGTFGAMSRG